MLTLICRFCQREIPVTKNIGTQNRNHCPHCLSSLHVDVETGDRKSKCHGIMKPVALTFKHASQKKYAKKVNRGELMLVHLCQKCGKISINRIAADDNAPHIEKILGASSNIKPELKASLFKLGITVAEESDREEVLSQLYGKR